MREWKATYRTDDTEKYEWCNAEAGLDFKKRRQTVVNTGEGKEAVRWKEKEMDRGVELSSIRSEQSKSVILFFIFFAQNV